MNRVEGNHRCLAELIESRRRRAPDASFLDAEGSWGRLLLDFSLMVHHR